jgi:methionyl-tRNA synthetase
LARYHRLLGKDVFFNTGTDEHGLKIYRKALEERKAPQAYVDEYAQKFDNLKKALNLSYNNFIRTTDKHHLAAAQEFWKRCQKKGDIYKDKQKIKYCVGCELEKTESELVNNRCPIHPKTELEIIEEENYFFRFSRYQESLLKLYRKQPNFVVPESKLKEITNFVAAGLRDFSISRLKRKLPWGVEVPDDPNHVMYVWFDALINYISALGWPKKTAEFNQWWPGIQTAGKDNLRQQSAMWQAMLMSAGLPNSQQILIHGFITSRGQKMSKSLGNVIDPFAVVRRYGTDAVRYYLLAKIPTTADGNFTPEHFEETYTADLANGLGNLAQRVASLCERSKLSFPGNLPGLEEIDLPGFKQTVENFHLNEALAHIWRHLKVLDRYIDQQHPWKLIGKDPKQLASVLEYVVTEIRKLPVLLAPFLPETAEKLRRQFSREKIVKGKPLFPRLT